MCAQGPAWVHGQAIGTLRPQSLPWTPGISYCCSSISMHPPNCAGFSVCVCVPTRIYIHIYTYTLTTALSRDSLYIMRRCLLCIPCSIHRGGISRDRGTATATYLCIHTWAHPFITYNTHVDRSVMYIYMSLYREMRNYVWAPYRTHCTQTSCYTHQVQCLLERHHYLPLNKIYTTPLYLSVEMYTYFCVCIYWLDVDVRDDISPWTLYLHSYL